MAIIYTPGNEPDNIKKRLNTLFAKIDTAYPDKVIFGLSRDHKKWGETVTELYRILGYENNIAFLNAYGYTVRVAEPKSPVGRQKTTDEKALIQTLVERYPEGASFKNLDELCDANPDFAAKKKTLSNNAMEYFGMTLVKYLKSLGLIYNPIKEEIPPKEKKVRVYHYFTAVIEGTGEKVFCAISTRILHVGDFVEMSNGIGEEKIIGSIIEMNHDTLQEDLPIPIEEMYRYNRKITKKEMNDIEASKVKYIYCSVRLEGRVDSLYYISPFKDIQIGDIVEVPHNWYGNVQGVVVGIEHVSEKTAPFSVKRTKEILRVVRSVRGETEKSRKREEELEQKYGAKEFIPLTVDDNLMEQYKNVTYFAGAVFRGLKWEIEKIQVQISIKAEKVSEEIYQFTCASSLVPKIIEEYPNLKGMFFAENWKEGNVYLAYSESGYSTVTSFRLIGKCDFYTRDRWPLIHDPSENCFKCSNIEYVFEEKNDWEKFNYVVMNGKKRLEGEAIIPSKPYSKKKTTDPCEIIEIHYPENEIFYETQKKSATKVVADKVIKNNLLSGKIFVVTGDLFNYSSREVLKEVIEQSGGKLAGSVSSKTTALITNYPNSGTTKIQKAKEYGVEIITEDEFMQRFIKKNG